MVERLTNEWLGRKGPVRCHTEPRVCKGRLVLKLIGERKVTPLLFTHPVDKQVVLPPACGRG